MPRPFTFAVVSSTQMTTSDLLLFEEAPAPNCAELWRRCLRRGVDQVWLTPSALRALSLPEELPKATPLASPLLEAGTLNAPASQDRLSSWLTFWNPEHRFEVGIPAWDRTSPWHPCVADYHLLSELISYSEALPGWRWVRNGAVTSDVWLRGHWRGLKSSGDPVDQGNNAEPDLVHVRGDLTPAEKRARYCHAYDLNAMYLSASSSIALPSGEARPVELWRGAEEGPGWWPLEKYVTSPTAIYRSPKGTVWCSDAYYWPESHRYLEPWYKALRDARGALLAEGGPALDAVKDIYRKGIGRLGSTKRPRDNDPLYHPYWRQAVMAEARCRLLRRIASFSARPFAVDVDCVFFLTSTSDPIVFGEKVGIPLGPGLGQFKVKGSGRAKTARAVVGERRSHAIPALREAVAA